LPYSRQNLCYLLDRAGRALPDAAGFKDKATTREERP
jgi:hypothetical protein